MHSSIMTHIVTGDTSYAWIIIFFFCTKINVSFNAIVCECSEAPLPTCTPIFGVSLHC